ncbi:putative transcriptional regulator [Cystobacter fuscus DSM 2262]|uniref:Transcriptional regulator n=1 Tax=Cystobacter fuscus (strain ATCC 25194 / DSM 2262 / NBRC 100088 / M29) TaxID=1242864 RepID=S9QGL5_CYSF2|nr:helix-turn-helix transcriptional regulator [Cystobacter fuscus]EPX60459.1 putative transcriptional regulator [Cystobacter fuscus DSM 2262]
MEEHAEGAAVKNESMTKKKLTVHLGETLRAARARAQWTQADVAERVGVATEVYGRMERGNLTPSVPILRALCGVLKMDADEALALEFREKAAWLKERPAPSVEESPGMRRLMRTLRQMDDKQLAALSMVARTLASSADD